MTRGAITSITASASDNVGVQRVVFSTSNGSASTDTSAPYSYAWSVPNTPNKSYTLTATAYDAAGNSTVSQITVKSSR